MVKGVIGIIFVGLILIGMLIGLLRGLKRSLLRAGGVIISAIMAFFLAPAFTNSFLNMDLSRYHIDMGDVAVTTVNDTIINALKSIPEVSDIISSSPTAESLILRIPAAIANLFLFLGLFIVLSLLFWIIYLIIAPFIIKKQDKNGDPANKHRLSGCAIGVVQAVVVFAVLFLPIAGTMNICNKEIKYINDYKNSTATVASASYDTKKAYADIYEEASTEETGSGATDAGESGKASEANNINVQEYVDQFNQAWPLKILNVFGYRTISSKSVEYLTTIKINGKQKVKLVDEADNLVKVYVRLERLKGININNLTNADLDIINDAIDCLFESKFIPDVLNELVVAVAKNWASADSEGTILSLTKPKVEGELGGALDAIITELTKSTPTTLKADLKALVKTVKVLNNSGLMKAISSGADNDAVIDALIADTNAIDLVGAMTEGVTLKNALPKVIESGLRFCYPLLNITEEESKTFIISTPASEVNWETEKVYLGNVFSNFGKVYKSLQKEGEIEDKIDYEALGVALNNIRASQLLNCPIEGDTTLGKELTILLVKKNLGKDDAAIAKLENSIRSTYDTIDFESALKTVSATIKVAKQLQDSMTDLNADDLMDVLDGMDTSKATDMIKNIASKDNLSQLGVDEPTADAISKMVNSVSDYTKSDDKATLPTTEQEKADAAEAVKTLYSTIKNENTGSHKFYNSKEEMKAFIDSIQKSNYVYKMTINNGVNLGFKVDSGKTNLDDTEYTWLTELIASEGYNAEDMTKLFGTK